MTWREDDLAMIAIQRRDQVAARRHLERAGEDERALLALGQLADDAGKPVLHWRAAAAGDTRAFLDLGTMFAYHKVDLVEAAHWYAEAAREGFEPASRELALLAPCLSEDTTRTRTMRGVMLAFFLGEPAEGARLPAVSAAQDGPVAQRSYAFLLQHGTGVQQDPVQAAALCRAVAAAGPCVGRLQHGFGPRRSP